MSVKDELRGLVDQLSDQGAAEAVRYLRWLMREEALRATLDAAPLDDEPETDEEARFPAPPVNVGRAATIDDPFTTGLLAEVARRSQTAEFDDDVIQDLLDNFDSGETHHPHTRRRSR